MKLKELSEISPILVIKVKKIFYFKILSSISSIEKGTFIKIDCKGILNNQSERNEQDGFVFFGYVPLLTTFNNIKTDYETKSINGNSFNLMNIKNIKEIKQENNSEKLKLDYNIHFNNINNPIDESCM